MQCFSEDEKCYFQEQMFRIMGSTMSALSAAQMASDRSAHALVHRNL